MLSCGGSCRSVTVSIIVIHYYDILVLLVLLLSVL